MVRSLGEFGIVKPARSESKYRLYSTDDLRILRRAIYLRRVQGLKASAILYQLKQEALLDARPAAPPAEQPSMGPRLRKVRLERGDSLINVANAVGVSKGFLSNVERSRSGVSVGIMRKLARYYSLNILDAFTPFDDARLW
jgi:DNA-binding transcriptional MerR regulator